MRFIYAEYNMYHNSVDVTTFDVRIQVCYSVYYICNFIYPACNIDITGRYLLTYKEFLYRKPISI